MKLTAETTLKGLAITMGAVAALMAAIELRAALDEEATEAAAIVENPLRAELQRCRSLAPQDLETDTACQAAWVENRRRFFGASSDNPGAE
ncbi:MAG: putative entry exclusion protein TrbK-alt [Pseudomonadota bacterium]